MKNPSEIGKKKHTAWTCKPYFGKNKLQVHIYIKGCHDMHCNNVHQRQHYMQWWEGMAYRYTTDLKLTNIYMYLARIVSINNNIPSSGQATLRASSPTTSAGARGVCGRLLDLITVPSLGLLFALALLAFDLLSVLDACESRCRFLPRWRCSRHSIASELVLEPDTVSDISADMMQKKPRTNSGLG